MQSAYFTGRSTETALMKIVDDILGHIDVGSIVALLILDFSVAFDMIDHNLLVERLRVEFGVTGAARLDSIISPIAKFFRPHRTVVI